MISKKLNLEEEYIEKKSRFEAIDGLKKKFHVLSPDEQMIVGQQYDVWMAKKTQKKLVAKAKFFPSHSFKNYKSSTAEIGV